MFEKQDTTIGEPRLQVRGLTRHGTFSDVTFTVHSGEIVALAGLVGAGRSEVIRAIFGIDRRDAGEVLVDGVAPAQRRHGRGHQGGARAGTRGPPPAGPGDGAVGRAQRHPAPADGR